MEHTLALIGRAHQGDKEARDTLFEENTGLIYSVARRFLGRGVEMEDLFQIGSIGLLKAVDKFDPAFEVKFSTYAIPMILGELKRFFRDDGMIKVSRSIKENQHRVYLAREKIEKELGREPSLKEIAEMLEMPPEEVAMTMDSAAEVESLYRTVYQSEGTDISLIDKIPEKENAEEHLLNRIFLEEILGKLESSDRKLLYMRYFQDQTQTQIAEQLGVSQVADGEEDIEEAEEFVSRWMITLFLDYVKTEYYILFALGFFVSEFIIKIFRRKVNERKDGISLI